MADGILNQSTDTPDPHDEEQDVEAAHRQIEQLRAMEEIEETKRLNAEVPEDLYKAFKEKCKREERSMSEVLREFLHAYTTD
jgi:Ribbon-helix-helix protein, copG family.